MRKDDRPPLKRRGWAPGAYFHHSCSRCDGAFEGDKRASTCANCAYDDSLWPLEEPPAPSATGIEAMVIEDIRKRQEFGLNKYGVTVADSPERLREWLEHAYFEHLDAAIYLRKAIDKIDRGEFFT